MQDNDLAGADRQGPQGDLDGEGVGRGRWRGRRRANAQQRRRSPPALAGGVGGQPQRDSADPRLGNVIAAQAGPARRGARERLLDKVLGLVEIAGHQRELADQPAEARGVEALELRVHVPRCPVHAGAPSGSAPSARRCKIHTAAAGPVASKPMRAGALPTRLGDGRKPLLRHRRGQPMGPTLRRAPPPARAPPPYASSCGRRSVSCRYAARTHPLAREPGLIT